ncbi:uncharacterized protein BXIN_2406 [Babesia sp. Xinjiang]|uniref:uncharacterized protein n=1 Tax=Babesia sp. Xinjiang TaxID=462227 RepID=UPI000A226B0A|nr:uncharacterized protein BXIN_2406 [Babesia sp. Xinjiang]ORM40719.1 hypothetical protein BXIN_2406 [Babesia sp. Xinjiang]
MAGTVDSERRRVYRQDEKRDESLNRDEHSPSHSYRYASSRNRSRSRCGDSPDGRSLPLRSRDSDGDVLKVHSHRRSPDTLVRCDSLEASGSDNIGTTDRNSRPSVPGSDGSRTSLPYIYQQAEFIRICTDLIRKCDCESELRLFLSTLDTGGSVDVSQYADAQVRKKFRHLGRALYLCRENTRLSKPAECNISLLEAFDEKLPYIRRKVESQGPYTRTCRGAEGTDSSLDAGATVSHRLGEEDSADTLVSLREMHEQGFFVGYEDVHKSFMSRHTSHDLWGKTPQQQLAMLRSSDSGPSSGDKGADQPWKVFDRGELESGSRIDRNGYDCLLQNVKESSASFGPGQSHSSFI